MNKKEAIAYAQITFESMMHSSYKRELSVENFGVEMRQAFKMYPRNIVLSIAEGKIYAERRLKAIKTGSDINGQWKRNSRLL